MSKHSPPVNAISGNGKRKATVTVLKTRYASPKNDKDVETHESWQFQRRWGWTPSGQRIHSMIMLFIEWSIHLVKGSTVGISCIQSCHNECASHESLPGKFRLGSEDKKWQRILSTVVCTSCAVGYLGDCGKLIIINYTCRRILGLLNFIVCLMDTWRSKMQLESRSFGILCTLILVGCVPSQVQLYLICGYSRCHTYLLVGFFAIIIHNQFFLGLHNNIPNQWQI